MRASRARPHVQFDARRLSRRFGALESLTGVFAGGALLRLRSDRLADVGGKGTERREIRRDASKELRCAADRFSGSHNELVCLGWAFVLFLC